MNDAACVWRHIHVTLFLPANLRRSEKGSRAKDLAGLGAEPKTLCRSIYAKKRKQSEGL